ncbi:MAG: hypothetical protein J2P37_36860, partial [Ktedonobacteraceae bacterium]|nr:hypothetical protein [Ktedonobacteraceae bacterium]
MAQEEVDATPQRGLLLRRAYELLESQGQPTPEDLLVQHLFGASNGKSGVWTMLLRQALNSSTLFEFSGTDDALWSLTA